MSDSDVSQKLNRIKNSVDVIRGVTNTKNEVIETVANEAENRIRLGDKAQEYLYNLINRSITSYEGNDTFIGSRAFGNCTKIETINLPLVESIEQEAFQGASSLISITLPKINYIGGYVFRSCAKLEYADLGNIQRINTSAFAGCSILKKVIIRSTSCVLLNSNVFDSTPISIKENEGFIYVPDEEVENYKIRTNWSLYASKIKAISELEEE